MNSVYDSMIAQYIAITQRYQSMLKALENEKTCDWAQMEMWIQENSQLMDLLPPIEAGMALQTGEIGLLKSTVELLLDLQDKVVSQVMAAKDVCGKGLQKQRSVQKVLQAYVQAPQHNAPQFQDKTL
ncbi:MAG: hypothetical protein HRU15_16535 [Planctomycetes bacterium]|nr:hypothetical protein [Planctomycetota bacterium]